MPRRQVHNRILAVMAHTTRYAFKGESRLAADAGVSKSAVSRLINGKSSPSFAHVHKLARAIEREIGKTVDPRELISFDGTYATPSVCELVGCSGCLPEDAYDPENILKPQWKGVQPGQWTVELNTAKPSVTRLEVPAVNRDTLQSQPKNRVDAV
ncbi:MAG: hypothetical protein JWN98_2444 [Abditibacteriota bacterium]|nr:hypothetical protein [Abditibacteriota bacterium]